MNVQDNYVTIPDGNFPKNRLWNPQADPNQLEELRAFLPTPADKVGIGLATWQDTLDLAAISQGIPVRLSTFTTNPVSVDYAIHRVETQNLASLQTGTLHFTPGETVKVIPTATLALASVSQIQVTLSNPVNADLTGHKQIIYRLPGAGTVR